MRLIDVLHLIDKSEVPSVKFDKTIHTDISDRVMLCFDGDDETFVELTCVHPLLIAWYDCEVYAIEGYENGNVNGIKCWLKYEDYAKQMLENWWEKNTEYETD